MAGKTVMQGSEATILGHVVSAGAGNVNLDGTSRALLTLSAGGTGSVEIISITLEVDGQPIQKGSSGVLVIGSLTIAPGSQATIYGHLVVNESRLRLVRSQPLRRHPCAYQNCKIYC